MTKYTSYNSKDLHNIVLNRIFSLKKLTEEIESSIPRFGPVNFLSALKLIIEAIEVSFISQSKTLRGESSAQHGDNVYLRYLVHLQIVHEKYLPLVEEVDSSYVLPEFLPPIVKFIQQIQATFIITEETLDCMKSEGISEDVLGNLKSLLNQVYKGKGRFYNTLQKTLGSKQTDRYGSLILKHAECQDFDLFFRPFWKHNYETNFLIDFVEWNLDYIYSAHELDHQILERAREFPKWFVFIFYPYIEHNNTLFQTLIAHEIGHFFDYSFGIHNRLLNYINLDQERAEELVKKLQRQQVGRISIPSSSAQLTLELSLPEDEVKQQVIEVSASILKNWLREFVSDLLAIRYMGPCYFFAAQELATMSQNINSYSDTHPSLAIRLVKLLEELRSLKYFDSKYPLSNELKRIENQLRKIVTEPEENEYYKLVYYSLVNEFAIIRRLVLEVISDQDSYDVFHYYRDVEQLCEALGKGVPPCEIKRDSHITNPASIPSIMNAGWEFYLNRFDQFLQLISASQPEHKAAALSNFNELLLKAVESSHILDHWQEKQGELDGSSY